jgi:hypothetical protein
MSRDRRGDGDQERTKAEGPTAGAASSIGKTTLTSLLAPRTAPGPGPPGPGRLAATEALPVQRKADRGASDVSRSATGPHGSHNIAALFGRPDNAPGGGQQVGVQRAPATHASTATGSNSPSLQITPPRAGIDKPGFIDNSEGSYLRTGPRETGGETVRDQPLPPATRVFVSGTHPSAPTWWYVTAYLADKTMVRGYVQGERVNTELPEPLAELRQLVGGETAEGLAKEQFGHAVTDGHDLRYYENVLLHMNQGRAGIRGTYQDPGVLGGGSNHIQLVAGHRIWLVSAEYAKALQSVVPSGSLTGGAVAKVKRFAGHLQDILHSVTESRNHFGEVAGEFAQAIRDHLPEIIGITAGFLMAEATSMFLAAAPTGVSQAAAAVIQLALAAFGASGMVQASLEALRHGAAWLTTAWTAHGKPELIGEASKEFLRMLVAVAMAALSYLGARGNYGNALQIARSMPTGGLPALATSGAGTTSGAGVGTGGAIGPSTGAIGPAGNAALRLSESEKAALGEGPDVDGLQDKDIGEARSRERRDRRAADGRKRPTAAEVEDKAPEGDNVARRRRQPRGETRTELAKHIPPPGDGFIEWFDSLSLAELDKLLADKGVKGAIGAREVLEENIRHPGGKHEWLMVAEARQFKKWGVSIRTIQEGRTFTEATVGKRFRHGATGSGAMHEELQAMVRSSNSYDEFLQKLNQWADRELAPSHSARWPREKPRGRYSLPDNLQVRSH